MVLSPFPGGPEEFFIRGADFFFQQGCLRESFSDLPKDSPFSKIPSEKRGSLSNAPGEIISADAAGKP